MNLKINLAVKILITAFLFFWIGYASGNTWHCYFMVSNKKAAIKTECSNFYEVLRIRGLTIITEGGKSPQNWSKNE